MTTRIQRERARLDAQREARAERTDDGVFRSKALEHRFGRTYGAVDQVLNPDVVAVEVVRDTTNRIPAWTDGEHITINAAGMPPLLKASRLEMATWIGVNVHELGHTIYTPRSKTPLMQRVKASASAFPTLPRVMNMLEDQRQERLVIAQFPPLKTYLLAAARHFLVREDEANGQAWVLVAGRTWLDVDARRRARDAFPGDARQVALIIGEYQRLGDPGITDSQRAFELVMEMHDLLSDASVSPPQGCGGTVQVEIRKGFDSPAVADDEDVPSAGSLDDELDDEDEADTDGSETDEDASDTRVSDGEDDDEGEDGDGDEGDAGPGDMGEGDADGDADEGNERQKGKSQGSSDSDDDEDGGDDDPFWGSDHDEHDGHGGDDSPDVDEVDMERWSKHRSARQQLSDDLTDQISDELGHSEVKQELDRLSKALEQVANDMKNMPIGPKSMVPVDHGLNRVAVDLGREFKRFTDAAQPYWERRVDHGKLNVQRYLRDEHFDPDTGFDRFDPGALDDLSLDVTILLDRSSSMGSGNGSNLDKACRAAWAIRRGTWEAEGECTIIAYDTAATLIVPAEKRPMRDKYEVCTGGGSTDPSDAAKYAWQRVAGMDVAHKLVICLTDGDWQGGGPAVRAMTEAGAVTIGLVLTEERYAANNPAYAKQHFEYAKTTMACEFTFALNDPMEMVGIFREIATDRMNRALVNSQAWR